MQSYFVVMIDYGRKDFEAVVNPEITREDVISRIRSREYDRINFIHHIHDGVAEDVTNELLAAAGFYEEDGCDAGAGCERRTKARMAQREMV